MLLLCRSTILFPKSRTGCTKIAHRTSLAIFTVNESYRKQFRSEDHFCPFSSQKKRFSSQRKSHVLGPRNVAQFKKKKTPPQPQQKRAISAHSVYECQNICMISHEGGSVSFSFFLSLSLFFFSVSLSLPLSRSKYMYIHIYVYVYVDISIFIYPSCLSLSLSRVSLSLSVSLWLPRSLSGSLSLSLSRLSLSLTLTLPCYLSLSLSLSLSLMVLW